MNQYTTPVFRPPAYNEAPRPYRPEPTRRLHQIPRQEQRVMESRLYWMRKVHFWRDEDIARELALVESDLPALAALAGKL